MTPFLRPAFLVLLAAISTSGLPGQAAPPRVLRLAHQYPGGTAEAGDFRDRLCRKFAAEVARRTNGALKFEVYANNELLKPEAQLEALQKGTVDGCAFTLHSHLGKMPELNILLLPGVIRGYDQASRWRADAIGKDVVTTLDRNGVVLLTWVWQAAGIVSAVKPITGPGDLRGLRIRGAAPSIDSMLTANGATVVNLPASEIPKGFRDRKLDAAVGTSSTLVAFRLQDFCRGVTTPRNRALFYFQVPLVMSKVVFDALPADQRQIIREVGASLEAFALASAKADDEALARAYLESGAAVSDLDDAQWLSWQQVARAAAWRDYERNVPAGADWLKKALSVP